MAFKVDIEQVASMLADDPSLGTLKNQYTVDEVWELLEDKDDIGNEEELYNALMAVMYATRPKGVL
jgi:hypothetical protein